MPVIIRRILNGLLLDAPTPGEYRPRLTFSQGGIRLEKGCFSLRMLEPPARSCAVNAGVVCTRQAPARALVVPVCCERGLYSRILLKNKAVNPPLPWARARPQPLTHRLGRLRGSRHTNPRYPTVSVSVLGPDKGHDRLAARCSVDPQLHWRSHLSLATASSQPFSAVGLLGSGSSSLQWLGSRARGSLYT